MGERERERERCATVSHYMQGLTLTEFVTGPVCEVTGLNVLVVMSPRQHRKKRRGKEEKKKKKRKKEREKKEEKKEHECYTAKFFCSQ